MKDESFFQELLERFKAPWHTTSFVLYFIFVIVIFGGVGIWLSFNQNNGIQIKLIADNMMTYSIALSIPACIAIILQYFPKANNKVSLIISTLSLLLIEVAVIFSFVFIDAGKIFIAAFGILLSWFFWVIANSDNKYLNDKSYNETIENDLKNHGQSWN